MEETQTLEKKKRFRIPAGFVIPAILCAIAIVALSVWTGITIVANTIGIVKKPVFFANGKIVEFIDVYPPKIEIQTVRTYTPPVVNAKNSDKEIQKMAYCIQSLQPKHSLESATLIARSTYNECMEKNISPALWIALMFAESSLDPMKVSSAGAYGLTQVRYSVWREQPELTDNGVLLRDKLFWIDLNIKCGTAIFKKFYDESGKKIGVALWRYNSGQTKLPENKRGYDIEYVAKIMYYTYKVSEILTEEDIKLHPINDPEAQLDSISGIAAPTPELKEFKSPPPIKKITPK